MSEYKKLPKKFKVKWLRALRSGEYKQAEGTLYDDGRYCCLGVAGNVCGVPDNILSQTDQYDMYYNNGEALVSQFDTKEAWDIIMKRVPAQLMRHNNTDAVNMLTRMNDSSKPFTEIADWIETNL